jgi:hypothetical protein
MRRCILSVGPITPVSAKRPRPWGEDVFLRAAGQPEGQSPGGEVIDGAVPAVGGHDAVVDETLVQGEVG